MIFNNILSANQSDILDDLLLRCASIQFDLNVERLKTLAMDAAKATNQGKSLPDSLNLILDQWYNSLSLDKPDYSVYGTDEYIAELWACWKVYSRVHLLNIQKTKCLPSGSIVDMHRNAKKIVDLGCGFAYTTAAIKQIFSDALVYGTNLDNTLQMSVARQIASDYHFKMTSNLIDISGETDLVFASEYFEHIDMPIQHLDYVIDTLQPKAMLIANAFGTKAIGHFLDYAVYENSSFPKVPAKQSSKIFNDRMRFHGYKKVVTKLWNNRPAYWVK